MSCTYTSQITMHPCNLRPRARCGKTRVVRVRRARAHVCWALVRELDVGALALLELTFRELHVLSHRKLPRPAVFALCPGPRCVVRRPHPPRAALCCRAPPPSCCAPPLAFFSSQPPHVSWVVRCNRRTSAFLQPQPRTAPAPPVAPHRGWPGSVARAAGLARLRSAAGAKVCREPCRGVVLSVCAAAATSQGQTVQQRAHRRCNSPCLSLSPSPSPAIQ